MGECGEEGEGKVLGCGIVIRIERGLECDGRRI